MLCCDGLKTQQRLRKNLLRRIAAQHLVDESDFHLAGRRGLRSSAVLDLAAQLLGGTHVFPVCGYFVPQPMIQQCLAELGKIRLRRVRAPDNLTGNLFSVRESRRLHQLKILLVLRGGATSHLVNPFAGMALA